MTLERKSRMESEQLTEDSRITFYTPTATTAVQMTVRDQVYRCTNNFAFTLSLPSVAEAAGLTFTISTVNATAAVTLTDFGGTGFNDSINWEGDFTLDDTEDTITVKSDGRTWHILEEEIG